MIVVLAVLAGVAAMGWPALRDSLDRSTLVNAAKQVSVQLTQTRLAAIESAALRQFRFQPGGKRYEVGPPDVFDVSAASSAAAASDAPNAVPEEFELPEGVRFFVPGAGEEPTVDDGGANIVVAGEWSAPVVFHPSGRGANSRIRLYGSRGLYVEVFVRGLTGSARIGPVLHEDLP